MKHREVQQLLEDAQHLTASAAALAGCYGVELDESTSDEQIQFWEMWTVELARGRCRLRGHSDERTLKRLLTDHKYRATIARARFITSLGMEPDTGYFRYANLPAERRVGYEREVIRVGREKCLTCEDDTPPTGGGIAMAA